jgi:hypothetical protein
MTRNRAAATLKMLAQGLHPATGEILPLGGVLSDVEVVRALFLGAEALQTQTASNSQSSELSRQGQPWSEAEDQQLRNSYARPKSTQQLAKEHGRSCGAIKARLVRLGLCDAEEDSVPIANSQDSI